jgi:hypothetical protein
MAIFVNHKRKVFVLTPYKVSYSRLKSQSQSGLKYIHYLINFTIYRHLVKYFKYKRYLIVKNPYDRFVSLFSDKYRKQPQRILEKIHTWENVHTSLFPYLNIKQEDSDEIIAPKFLNMTISYFLKIQPLVINEDEHFMPHRTTKQWKLFDKFFISLRIDGYFRLEDHQEYLTYLTGIDFGIKKNTINSKNLKDSLTTKDFLILDKVYKKDFVLGNYTMLTQSLI